MALTALALVSLVLAAIPALLFLANLREYRPPPAFSDREGPPVSVLIPARDEAEVIGAAVTSALASRGVSIEVVVLDDHSTDATAAIVADLAGRDPRVRLIPGGGLPEGWCGKQHACARLAGAARHGRLAFLDADVRLDPDGLARLSAFLDASGAGLVSGIPRQETGTIAERLVIPLIHFVLLGFLPIRRMRGSAHPAYAAGCGQIFLTDRDAYDRAGGHAAIRASLHDGLTLPRAYRRAGLPTDLCDLTDVATCRMYRGLGPLWAGLAKNAGEALAAPRMIGPATLILAGGQVGPFLLLAAGPWLPAPALVIAIVAAVLAWLPRFAGVVRFRQSPVGAILHPIGVALLLAIQWHAFALARLGRTAAWKGRAYLAR